MKNKLPFFLESIPEFKQIYGDKNESLYVYNVQGDFPEQWEKLNDKEKHERRWYYSICSFEEVNRIINPQNVTDYLLKMRADSIFNNIRINRVFSKRAEYIEELKWSLMEQFDDTIFERFKKEVVPLYNTELNQTLFGTIYSDRPNGSCIKTKFGKIIVISEALKYFLYYMNLLFFDLDDINIISMETRITALLIALRTMLLKESFDFELDPRGDIPDKLDVILNEITNNELLYIISHEYAHIILNHFNENNIMQYRLYKDVTNKFKSDSLYEYHCSKKKEYEADIIAIDILCGNDSIKQKSVLLNAVTVTAYIDIFYYTKNLIKGKTQKNLTHPLSHKRLKKLLKRGKKIWDKEELKIISIILKNSEHIKKYIKKYYNEDPHIFNFYGSIYFKQWKKEIKKDRIDF